jgi:hypothetical protein
MKNVPRRIGIRHLIGDETSLDVMRCSPQRRCPARAALMQNPAKWASFMLLSPDFLCEKGITEANVVKGPLIFAEAVEQTRHLVTLLPFRNNGLSQVIKPRHGILLLVSRSKIRTCC